mgnify:CR=1 FL=1
MIALGRSAQVQTMSFANDAATGLVLIGTGLLEGREPLLELSGTSALHFIRRNDDGWSVSQSLWFLGSAYEPNVFDLDGDGLQDLLIVADRGSRPAELHFYRQESSGRFRERETVVLPDSTHPEIITRTGTVGGVMLLGRLGTTGCLWAARLQRDTDSTLRLLWERRFCSDEVRSSRVRGWVDSGDSGLALVEEYRGEDEELRSWTVDVDGGTWLESPTPPRGVPFRLNSIVRGGRPETWTWAQPPDSLYRLEPDAAGRIVFRGVPIDGVPPDWRRYDNLGIDVAVASDPFVFAAVGWNGNGDEVRLAQLEEDGSAVVVDRWENLPPLIGSNSLAGILRDATGALETLLDPEGALVAIARSGEPIAVDFPIDFLRNLPSRDHTLYQDLTGDGITDLVTDFRAGDAWRFHLFVGIPHPPWFLPPAPIAMERSELRLESGDFDGDGTNDLLFMGEREGARRSSIGTAVGSAHTTATARAGASSGSGRFRAALTPFGPPKW